nr:hypothetical protein [Tanacetum cinerariifolium]
MVKKKGLIAKDYEGDKEEVSSDDNEMVEVKVLMALAEDNDAVSKEGAKNGLSRKSWTIEAEKKAVDKGVAETRDLLFSVS